MRCLLTPPDTRWASVHLDAVATVAMRAKGSRPPRDMARVAAALPSCRCSRRIHKCSILRACFALLAAAAPAWGIRVQVMPSEDLNSSVIAKSDSPELEGPLWSDATDDLLHLAGSRTSSTLEHLHRIDCTASTISQAMHDLKSRSQTSDGGGGCLTTDDLVVGCKEATCQCGTLQHCYPHEACGMDVGTCDLSLPVLVVCSVLIFGFTLSVIVTCRMLFQIREEKQGDFLVPKPADLARRSFKGRTSRSVPTTEWPKIDEDELDGLDEAEIVAGRIAAGREGDVDDFPALGSSCSVDDDSSEVASDTPDAERIAKKKGRTAF